MSSEKVVDQKRVRFFPENNYCALYDQGHVTRFILRDSEELITPLPVPEFMDIKLTNACDGGCEYCYQSSTPDGFHAKDPVGRLAEYFHTMLESKGLTADSLPFQVALGGGEPTLHPEFVDVCEFLAANTIVPNYTTNGLHLTDEVMKATDMFVGSAAVTCHPHLDDTWPAAFDRLTTITNAGLHVLVHDEDSVMRLYDIVEEYWQKAYYIVVLPFANQGRAADSPLEVDYNMLNVLVSHMLNKEQRAKLAWGALAYDFIRHHPILSAELSLYEPEEFSRYLDLTTMKEYPSSFLTDEIR